MVIRYLLRVLRFFGMHYQIVCYVPNEHVELVKSAMFAAGAGQFSGYRHCCWQTLGQGQFLPEHGSLPHIGSVGKTTTVEEGKLEMFCDQSVVTEVVDALKNAHPYEVPAFAVLKNVMGVG